MNYAKVSFSLATLAIFLGALTAQAGSVNPIPINFDPLLPAPAPILDAGWQYDEITGVGTPSSDSPYVYNLAAPAVFTITDDYVVGDVFTVSDFGTTILVTTYLGAMPPFGGDPSGWLSASYTKGSVLLAAGSHSLVVVGDGAGGVPAGFSTRLDSSAVPEPSTLALLGVGLGALCVLRRRKSH
jgi:hypothetical protein